MTLERIDANLEPGPLRYEIEFARVRMERFWGEARKNAVLADTIMAQHLGEINPKSRMYPDRASATQIALKDPERIDAISHQAMYDRWTIREAAVLQALIAYKSIGPYQGMTVNLEEYIRKVQDTFDE